MRMRWNSGVVPGEMRMRWNSGVVPGEMRMTEMEWPNRCCG